MAGRKRLLALIVAVSAVVALTACGTGSSRPHSSSGPAAVPRWSGPADGSGVTLRWLGNNAWEITFGSTTVLVDPWLTRFPTGTYTPAGPRLDTPLTTDPAAIDPYVDRAATILVTHGHFDHMADVPYIATRTGARVLGTASHLNMLRALDVPPGQLTEVSAGKHLSYDGYTVDVFPSRHSLGANRQVPIPGLRTDGPPSRPKTIAGLVEGGTLAYLITIAGRFRIFVLGSANLEEAALRGVHPDLAIVPAGGGDLPGYANRLMRALGNPTWVVPSHWDDFDLPLSQPARDWGGLRNLQDALAAASPGSTFVKLEHLQTFTP